MHNILIKDLHHKYCQKFYPLYNNTTVKLKQNLNVTTWTIFIVWKTLLLCKLFRVLALNLNWFIKIEKQIYQMHSLYSLICP